MTTRHTHIYNDLTKRRFRTKKLVLISTAVIICLSFVCISVYSAENKDSGSKSIFEYKKELALTDKQEKNLKDILAKLQNYLTDKQKELNGLRDELGKMIAQRADLDKIKMKLNDIAKIQAEASYEDIASTRAIETELTGTQLTKWRGIQEEFRKNLQDAQAAAVKAAEENQAKK